RDAERRTRQLLAVRAMADRDPGRVDLGFVPDASAVAGALHFHASRPNLTAARARARAASVSRSRGAAVVTSERISTRAAAATSSTAWSKAASFAFDGTLNPLSLRTNCSEASRISSSVAGGSKLNSVLMFLHMMVSTAL